MNKVFVCRLFAATLGLLTMLAWTNPLDPSEINFVNSHLDEQEEIIRERIPTVVSIVNPVYNPAVRSYLNTYIYRRPEHTASMIGWASYYFPKFEKALAEEGLPTDLKYLAIVESALNPNAISRSGAGGLWQFMKPTARECGLKVGTYVDERMDPEKSTKAAVHYLKQLYKMFGNWELVMAAYNAGPGRVRSAVKRAGTNDYWKLDKYLPLETRSYVPGFIAASYLMNFHTEHDLIPVFPEHAMGELMTVTLHDGMSITELAKRTGLTVEAVKALNPSFVRNWIPASQNGYTIVLPAASAELFNSNRIMEVPGLPMEVITEANAAVDANINTVNINGKMYYVKTSYLQYKVRSGDNLYNIANRHDCTVKELMTWNKLRDSRLAIGQRLEIRKEVKELVPIIEEKPLLVNSRTIQALEELPGRSFCMFTCNASDDEVKFCIEPCVKDRSGETVVLKRRQSLRQALGTSSAFEAEQVLMPKSAATGDVVRLITRT